MNDTFLIITFIAVGVSTTALVFWGLFRLTRTKLQRAGVSELTSSKDAGVSELTLSKDKDGVNVLLVAAFAGWKAIPWVAWAHSDISPLLLLQKHHVTCRVVRKRRHAYDEIEYVDFRKTLGTTNIVLVFKEKLTTFSGNTANAKLAAEALEIFRQKGCRLSQRAQQLLEQNAMDGSF
ncbi:hypothetical protein [Pusillimonas sp. ANT_WB101]|uniref:hypothetical protein n=1 Tax=Pusillimonas sp. ANT_WB101 TaxID=2597356 RepID=UPI001CAA8805|nr:hypothetical protein [Pusillimonas sp. ANT_WB101]